MNIGSLPLIVAIDDDEKVLRLVTDSLDAGYQLRTFAAPEQALAAFGRGLKPDLIVCDISMPETSGFEVHQAVRDMTGLRGVPFVYLTALDDREHMRRGMNLGADDYLTKPFHPRELREMVRLRLERAQTLKGGASKERLEVHSLGGFALLWHAQPRRWEAKRAAEVFLYLLSAQYRDAREAVPLASLKAEVWREPIEDNTLYVTLKRLRKMLPPVVTLGLRKGRGRLELSAELRWDALGYYQAATQALETGQHAQLENAIARYRGEFLPGFDSPWSDAERHRYENLYARLLQAAIDAAPHATARAIAEARLDKFVNA